MLKMTDTLALTLVYCSEIINLVLHIHVLYIRMKFYLDVQYKYACE